MKGKNSLASAFGESPLLVGQRAVPVGALASGVLAASNGAGWRRCVAG